VSYERQLKPDPAGGRRRLSLSGAVTAAPDVVLGLTYLALLVDRTLLPETTVVRLAWAIPIEFAVVHASGFLALPWVARWDAKKRAIYAPALIAGYTIAVGGIALLVHGWWPLIAFWGLMFNRMLAVMVGDLPDDDAFSAWAIAWAGSTTLYVLAVCIGTVAAARATVMQALFMGFLYFTMVGLSEITRWGWVYRWQKNAQKRAAARK